MSRQSRTRVPELIQTDHDLDDFWRAVMGPLGFGNRRFWLVMIEPDGMPIKQLMQVDDVPHEMSVREADSLMHAFGKPVAQLMPGGSLAILFSRPGRDRMGAADRRLAVRITAAAERAGVRLRPLYFANDVELRVFAVDDLLSEAS